MRKLGVLAAPAVGLLAGLLAPAPAASQPLTLDTCVRMALRENLEVEQARGAVREARADVVGARSAFLPQLTARGTWTRPEQAIGFIRGDQQSVQFFDELWQYNATASVLLFDGWGNVSAYQAASRNRTAASHRLQDAGQRVVFETERRFFEVLKTTALLDVQEEAVTASEEQLKKTRAMKELGASTLADVYKAEVDHANNRLEALRAERNLEVARSFLLSYLGLAPGTELDLEEEEGQEEAGVENLAQALEQAGQANPSVRASRATEGAASAAVTSAKADRYPSLSAWYSAGYSFGQPSEFEDANIDLSYGLSMNFTIFDGLLTKSRIRRAESGLLTARRAVQAAQHDAEHGVRQAWLDLEIAREAISVSEDAVRSSEEDLRLARERYRLGEGTILDVIDAQVNLTRSRTSLVNATYDRRLASSALRDAIGVLHVPEPAR